MRRAAEHHADMITTKQQPTARDFFEYLLQREQTHELALQLAYVYDQRQVRRDRVASR
jgi:Mn-containing catalase